MPYHLEAKVGESQRLLQAITQGEPALARELVELRNHPTNEFVAGLNRLGRLVTQCAQRRS